MSDGFESVPLAGEHFGAPIPASMLTPPAFDSESEEALALRYGRLVSPPQELVYEFTRDPGLLHQYHAIYEREFSVVHKTNYQYTLEDQEEDRRSHILVVKQGRFCVGGARLSVKTPRQPHPLPIEMDGFRIEDYFPYLGEKQLTYGQLGRICLLPDFRGKANTRLLFWHIHRKAVALGVRELFGTATAIGSRSYRKDCGAIGLDMKIYRDIDLPKYPMCEEIKFYLVSAVLDKAPMEDVEELMEEDAYSLYERAYQ